MYFYRHRHFDPTVGRWLDRDPIGYWAGVLTCTVTSQTVQSYAGTRPVLFQFSYLPPHRLLQPQTPPLRLLLWSPPLRLLARLPASIGVGYWIGTYTTGPLVGWIADWWYDNPRPEKNSRTNHNRTEVTERGRGTE